MSKLYKPVCKDEIDGNVIAINESHDVIIAGTDGSGSGLSTIQLGRNPATILAIALYLQHLVANHMGVNIEDLVHQAMSMEPEEEESINVNVMPESHHRH